MKNFGIALLLLFVACLFGAVVSWFACAKTLLFIFSGVGVSVMLIAQLFSEEWEG